VRLLPERLVLTAWRNNTIEIEAEAVRQV